MSLSSCKSLYDNNYEKPSLVDEEVSYSTRKLHKKLSLIADKGIVIGHQDATSYGIKWTYVPKTKIYNSDIQKVVGDYPGVYGFDIGHVELNNNKNLDLIPFEDIRNLIIDAHSKGGIITISWHLDNPVTDGNSWDPTPAVKQILPAGKQRDKYKLWVNRLADFIKSLKYKGKKIPIILRPYHEMNGSWFWWGGDNCAPLDYVALWKDIVHLLRDTHQVNQILYTFSPNKLGENDQYLDYYPGDDYVDILGIDIYDFNNSEDYIKSLVNDIGVMSKLAKEKKKLYAFTETGLEKIPTQKWFSEVLFPSIKDTGIAWVLFWRNGRESHHYVPYPGHASEKDFKYFAEMPEVLFLNDINQLDKP